jgi:hypothetical protein
MSRTPFNWSLLDRKSLYNMLYVLRPSIVNKQLPIKTLQKILSDHIKAHLPIKITIQQNPNHELGYVYVGGTYYAHYDTQGKRQIEINFSYKNTNSTIKINHYKWKRVCMLFSDTILHEIIHLRQYRSRRFKEIPGYLSTAYYVKNRKEQEYYGHKDEMGAFAFNIACELYDKFGDDLDSIKQCLNNLTKKHKKTSWYNYLKAFNYDHQHPIIRSMKKKIIRNLPYARIGKPFKTTDHLTY